MGNYKRKKTIILHFQPLELYPPVLNMIEFLKNETAVNLKVISNRKSSANKLETYDAGKAVKIYRPGFQSKNNLIRYVGYFAYYLASFVLLLWHRPQTVLYIETLSSWPAIIYKKIRGNKVKLMVHYHEYTEPILYSEGMALSRWFHRIESKMYKNFSWISHTNNERMKMFKDDENLDMMPETIFHIMPNYPPQKWIVNKIRDTKESPVKKLVFVGSLGYQNMYLQEIVDWVKTKQGEFTIDFYAYNVKDKAKDLLENSDHKNIKYCGGCNYMSLPQILKNYDIGLVIYKPFSKNTVHAVSNKVFEYLACGLDVWFSNDMTYSFNYVREKVYPKVIPVNFDQLQQFDHKSAISREGIRFEPSPYYYEKVYVALRDFILN